MSKKYLIDFPSFIEEVRDYWKQRAPKHSDEIDSLVDSLKEKYDQYIKKGISKFKNHIFFMYFGFYNSYVKFDWSTIEYFKNNCEEKLGIDFTGCAVLLQKMDLYTKTLDTNKDNWFKINTQQNRIEKNTAYIDTENLITGKTFIDGLESLGKKIQSCLTDVAHFKINKPKILIPERKGVKPFYEWSGFDRLVKDLDIKLPGFNA